MTLRTCAAVIASALLATACGGEDGPTGITAGMAVGKFCHQLRRTAGAIDLTLEFGDPGIADGGSAPPGTVPFAKITARTDTCAPPPGEPCVVIPVGRVPLRLMEGTKVLGTRTVILENGKEYGFEPVVSPTGREIGLEGGSLMMGECQNVAFPDAGIPDGGTDAVSSDAVRAEGGATDATTDAVVTGDVAAPGDAADAGVASDALAVDAPADAAMPSAEVGIDGPEADAGTADAAVVDSAVD